MTAAQERSAIDSGRPRIRTPTPLRPAARCDRSGRLLTMLNRRLKSTSTFAATFALNPIAPSVDQYDPFENRMSGSDALPAAPLASSV